MTHKIKIGNRVINLSDPQKKLLDEMDDDTFIKNTTDGCIRYHNKDKSPYVGINKERTIMSLLNKGVLIQQKTEYGYYKIIKSF